MHVKVMSELIKPSVGRIVHYHPSGGGEEVPNTSGPYPAIITKVHSDDCANLQVLTDTGPMFVATSRMRSDEGLPGTWSWPPRV